MHTEFKAMVTKEIRNLLEETFVLHHGAYTDKGTSLSETLAAIDDRRASLAVPGHKETIAGHVFHTKYYVRVLIEYMKGIRSGKTNWDESWVVTTVDAGGWERLKSDLLAAYGELMVFVDAEADWQNEDHFGGVLATLAHCAYHLGAIRQLQEAWTT